MLKISKQELTYLLKALVEHKTQLEKVSSYPSKESDLRPYNSLIRKLTAYRTAHFSRPLLSKKEHSPRR